MALKVVELEEGVRVQVQTAGRELGAMGMGDIRNKRESGVQRSKQSMDQITDLVTRTCHPFTQAIRRLEALDAEGVSLEFGIGFTGKGEAFVVDSQSAANFNVKVKWQLKPEDAR